MQDDKIQQGVEMVMKAIRNSSQDKTVLLKQLKKANKVLETKNHFNNKRKVA